MDPLIYHNDRMVEAQSAGIPITVAGLVYGWGAFTMLRVYDGEPFAFDYHWERLTKNADKLRIRLPADRDETLSALRSLIAANSRDQGRLRITVLKGEAGAWRLGGNVGPQLLIFSADEPSTPQDQLAVTVSPYRVLSTAQLAGVKQTAMLEHLLAFEEARSRGFDEAVMLNERGEIVGATAANIFWVEADEVFTPGLSTGCVSGVTRRLVHELAVKWKLHVVEGSFSVTRLLSAREAFLTSTQREIAIVRSFDAKEYVPDQARISGLIARQFRKLARGDAG